MKKALGIIIASMFLWVSITACDSGTSDIEGEGCATIGDYTCSENIVHLCKSYGWEGKEDCGESSTSDCKCTIIQGIGACTVGGGGQTECSGKRL